MLIWMVLSRFGGKEREMRVAAFDKPLPHVMYANHFGTPSPLFRLLPEFPSHFQSSKGREDNHNSRHAVCSSWHKLDEVIVDCVPTLLFLPLIILPSNAEHRVGRSYAFPLYPYLASRNWLPWLPERRRNHI
jgi:hypothetical protein